MYFYSLNDYEGRIILTNDKKISQKDFVRMCKETHSNIKYYDTNDIIKYLVKYYGFKTINITAGFFIGGFIL